MRTYKLAKFLASVFIVLGLTAAFLFGSLAVLGFGSPTNEMLDWVSALIVAIAGLFSALSAFGFLALFDIAEAVTKERANV